MIIYTGLPRSGTNLLKNILSQNNELFVDHESVLFYIIFQVLNAPRLENLDKHFNYLENEITLKNKINNFIIGGISKLESLKNKTYIDHNKAWLKVLPYLIHLNYKVIISVRNIKDILGSIENQRKDNVIFDDLSFVNLNCTNPLLERIDYYTQNIPGLHWGISFINELCQNTRLQKNVLIIKYEDLTSNPQKTLNNVYDFIGIKKFDHDFKDIKEEGFPDMHVADRLLFSHKVNKQIKEGKTYSYDSTTNDFLNQKFFSYLKFLGYIN